MKTPVILCIQEMLFNKDSITQNCGFRMGEATQFSVFTEERRRWSNCEPAVVLPWANHQAARPLVYSLLLFVKLPNQQLLKHLKKQNEHHNGSDARMHSDSWSRQLCCDPVTLIGLRLRDSLFLKKHAKCGCQAGCINPLRLYPLLPIYFGVVPNGLPQTLLHHAESHRLSSWANSSLQEAPRRW